MRWGLCVVVLCGCFHPTTAFDIPCSPLGDCPDNQVCDVSRAPPTCVAALSDASSPQVDSPVTAIDAPATLVDGAHPDGMNPTPDGAMMLDAAMIADAPPVVPIVYVQSATTKPAAALTTLALPGAVAAHDAILVAFNYPTGPTLTDVTDNAGNNYQVVVGPVVSGGDTHYVAIALDVAGVSADTLTLSLSAAPSGGSDWLVLEYSGLAHTSAFDVTANASGTGTALSSGTATTTFGHELILGYAETGSATAGSGFTSRATQSGNMIEDRTVTATGTYSATAGTSGGGTWTMIMATFRGM